MAMSLLQQHLIYSFQPWNFNDLFRLNNWFHKECLQMKSKISKVPKEWWRLKPFMDFPDFCEGKRFVTLTGASNPLYATSAQASFFKGKQQHFFGAEKGSTERSHKSTCLSENLKKWDWAIISYQCFLQYCSNVQKAISCKLELVFFLHSIESLPSKYIEFRLEIWCRTGHRNFSCVINFSRFIPLFWGTHNQQLRFDGNKTFLDPTPTSGGIASFRTCQLGRSLKCL